MKIVNHEKALRIHPLVNRVDEHRMIISLTDSVTLVGCPESGVTRIGVLDPVRISAGNRQWASGTPGIESVFDSFNALPRMPFLVKHRLPAR